MMQRLNADKLIVFALPESVLQLPSINMCFHYLTPRPIFVIIDDDVLPEGASLPLHAIRILLKFYDAAACRIREIDVKIFRRNVQPFPQPKLALPDRSWVTPIRQALPNFTPHHQRLRSCIFKLAIQSVALLAHRLEIRGHHDGSRYSLLVRSASKAPRACLPQEDADSWPCPLTRSNYRS